MSQRTHADSTSDGKGGGRSGKSSQEHHGLRAAVTELAKYAAGTDGYLTKDGAIAVSKLISALFAKKPALIPIPGGNSLTSEQLKEFSSSPRELVVTNQVDPTFGRTTDKPAAEGGSSDDNGADSDDGAASGASGTSSDGDVDDEALADQIRQLQRRQARRRRTTKGATRTVRALPTGLQEARVQTISLLGRE